MAKAKPAEQTGVAVHKSLAKPTVFLFRMLVFLVLVGFIVSILFNQIKVAFLNNPGLNGLIVGVLLIGIIYAFRQVIRLYPEIRWVNSFRIADPGLATSVKPVLLGPMATMLRDRKGALSLSTVAMRSIMDSIGSRLDEARDIARYLVGLLVFLGLLGTFWGLLDTISSVGKVIGALDTKQSDSVLVFEELKKGLSAPLNGMGTAFSSSLLGLAGSLVLGFLDLQTSQAHNRFYNELEDWLSAITELTPGTSASDRGMQDVSYALYEIQRALAGLADRVSAPAPSPEHAASVDALAELARGVDQLVRQMRTEQKVVREWVDEQASQQMEVAALLRELSGNVGKTRGK